MVIMSENTPLTKAQSHDYADQLLVANDTDEAVTIIGDIESSHNVVWRSLGDDENNYSTVHNQAGEPMPAFTELVLNSADAQMFKFYEDCADESVGPKEYKSMKAAVEADWVDLDDADIEVLADGLKPREGNILNLTIRDDAKGKGRTDFGDFVGLSKPGLKKQEYGFCQGQYGMGSTGVMKFCGDTDKEYNERCFKFIASASIDAPGKWSWTLVRDNPHKGQFEYLTIDNDFAIFDGSFGGALADKFRENYPNEYDVDSNTTPPEAQKYGSFVKVYDYDTNCTRSIISGYTGFRRKLERFLVDSPFPVRLTDMRYDVKVVQSETRGFLPTLRDGREHLLKGEEHIRIETDSETLGERDVHVLLFKTDEELENIDTTDRGKQTFVAGTTSHKDAVSPTGIQRDHAVMLTVNGQTHGSKGQFFLEKLGYSKVAEDTVVIVEFDDLANLGMVKMFEPSRDNLTDSPQTQKFIICLKEGLKNSDLLGEEEERRRATRGSDEEHVDTETFQEFIEGHPDIANYIASGEKVTTSYLRPTDDGANGEFNPSDEGLAQTTTNNDGEGEDTGKADVGEVEPPMLPTYLRPIEEYDPDGDHKYWNDERGYMPVEMPVNRRAKIRFETDAQNDYLAREVLSGSLNIWPSARFFSVELCDGLLTLTIAPENDADIGDDFGLNVELTRPDPTECDFIDDPEEAFPSYDANSETETDIAADGGNVDTSPLTAGFYVEYVEAEEPPSYTATPPTSDDEDDKGNEGHDVEDVGETDENAEAGEGEHDDERTVDMPDIKRVYEEHWKVDNDGDPIDEEEFRPDIASKFDENTLLHVDPSRDGTISGLTLTVNMDAAPLRRFIIDRNVKDNWKEFVERQYEFAVVFYAISQYRELVEAYGQSLEGSQILTTEIVGSAINGIGQTLMPTIIPEDQLDRISD